MCPSEGHKHGVSIQKLSINLGDTLLQITCEWKTAGTWFLASLFICQLAIIPQIIDFIHWMDMIFKVDHMTGENREYDEANQIFVNDDCRKAIQWHLVNYKFKWVT